MISQLPHLISQLLRTKAAIAQRLRTKEMSGQHLRNAYPCTLTVSPASRASKKVDTRESGHAQESTWTRKRITVDTRRGSYSRQSTDPLHPDLSHRVPIFKGPNNLNV